ncbi:guanylate kinase [Falsiporphyromonas endometrii]|uniref:Guanylate kinase n=1 Tax=Falsiporphyromonas endometrii TaxID=1387297 RepID=A0ABV9K5Y8_9PORP
MTKLIIFTAPSGTGKSTIIKELFKRLPEYNFHFSISATSRAPRGSERNGVEYYFISPDEFRQNIKEDRFIEYEEVYKDTYYGTLKTEVDKRLENKENLIFDIDVAGAMNIKKQYKDRALALFIMPPSIETLRQRLEDRATDAPKVIEMRLAKAEKEMSQAKKFDKIITNDDLETCCKEVVEVIKDFIGEPEKEEDTEEDEK